MLCGDRILGNNKAEKRDRVLCGKRVGYNSKYCQKNNQGNNQ